MHKALDLPILYFGTPVVLIGTINEDGSQNIAPSSSIWWLGNSCMIGLDGSSKTSENLKRNGQCVLNMASADIVDAVDRIANTTGTHSVPLHKKNLGYKHVKDKTGLAGLSTQSGIKVNAPRICQCKVQLEATVEKIHNFAESHENAIIPMFAFELNIVQSHIEESILHGEKNRYVDPDKWHPLIMSFRKFYTTHEYIHPSTLSKASVEKYRLRKMKGLKGVLLKNVFKLLYKKYRHNSV